MRATTCDQCGQKNRVPSGHLADVGKCGACAKPFGPVHEPLDVDTASFDEIVKNAKVPVLVDFWATWCPPCRMAAPEVKKTARATAGKGLVLKVDTDQNPELSARFGIQGIPSFLVFMNGKPVVQQAGLVDHRQMLRWLEDAAGA